jgi:hypothetical protein
MDCAAPLLSFRLSATLTTFVVVPPVVPPPVPLDDVPGADPPQPDNDAPRIATAINAEILANEILITGFTPG